MWPISMACSTVGTSMETCTMGGGTLHERLERGRSLAGDCGTDSDRARRVTR